VSTERGTWPSPAPAPESSAELGMSPGGGPEGDDEHGLWRDPEGPDDWEWRRRLRSNPTTRTLYRATVAILGLALVAGGLALVPLPGPGWLIVILGLAVWASEFEPAERLLGFVRDKVRAWESWVVERSWWVKGMLGLGTALVVGAVLWTTLRISGLPGFFPDHVTAWMQQYLAL
jgi:uncharacterized protein (TIGR02611 family)